MSAPTAADSSPSDLNPPGQSPQLENTNYGSQVTYNYGSISNYFCYGSETAHRHKLPVVALRKDARTTALSKKIARAHNLYKLKRWNEARVLFYEILFTHDTTPDVTQTMSIKYNLAHTHFALMELEDAQTHFQDVADIIEENIDLFDEAIADSRYWLARTFYHQQKYEKASLNLQIFIQAQNLDKINQELHAINGRLWLGLTFEKLEQYESAREQLELAHKMRRYAYGTKSLETLASRHHLANFLYKRKQYTEACDHFKHLLEIEEELQGPEKSQAIKTRCMLALCLAKTQRYNEAEPHFQRLYTRLSSIGYITQSEAIDFGLVCYWQGRIALTRPMPLIQFDETESTLQKALRLLALDENLKEELVDCRMILARMMLDKGQAAGAEQAIRQVLDDTTEKSSKPIREHIVLVESLHAQGKFQEAKSVLEKVITVESSLENSSQYGDDLATCLHLLGTTHHHLGEFQKARECFVKVVDAKPDEPCQNHNWSRLELGKTLFFLGEIEAALCHFQETYSVGTKLRSNTAVHSQFWLAWALCETESFDEAEKNIHQALAVFPSTRSMRNEDNYLIARSNYYLGWIEAERHNYEEAERFCRDALSQSLVWNDRESFEYLECLYLLAKALVSLGKYGEAHIKLKELLDSKCNKRSLESIRCVSVPFILGCSLVKQGKEIEAEPYLEQCWNAPREGQAAMEIPRKKIASWYAVCCLSNGKFSRSVELLQEARDPASDNEKDKNTDLYNQSTLGRSLFFLGKYEECIECLTTSRIHIQYMASADDLFLAMSFWEVKRYNEAEALFSRAALLPNASPDTYNGTIKALGSYWLGLSAYFRRSIETAEQHFHAVRVFGSDDRFKNYSGWTVDPVTIYLNISQETLLTLLSFV